MDDLVLPFMFVPDGAAPDEEWLARYPGWVKFPATLVWRHAVEAAGVARAGRQAGTDYRLSDEPEGPAPFRNREVEVNAATTTTEFAPQSRAAPSAAASLPALAVQPSTIETGYTTNPDYAARALGLDRNDVGCAIHILKDNRSIRGDENLRFHIPSGDVFFNDEKIGNLFDEC